MGASDFMIYGKGATARDAFNGAVSQAQHDYGHAGYTGTIAEKTTFVMIPIKPDEDADEVVNRLMNDGDPRIDNKWGPAGCIAPGDDTYLFFGWASS